MLEGKSNSYLPSLLASYFFKLAHNGIAIFYPYACEGSRSPHSAQVSDPILIFSLFFTI